MKTVFTIFSVLLGFVSVAQNEDVIDGFTATEFNGKVLLTWSVKQGNTCNGVDILHSLDSVNFTKIGSIEGICGSTQASIAYDFTDLDPEKNVINYYRLQLGGIGYSKIVGAEVLDLAGSNFTIRPNPISDFSELIFDNETAATYKLTVFAPDGTIAYSDRTNGELFLLSRLDFDQGFYFFNIAKEGDKPKIAGKFMVY